MVRPLYAPLSVILSWPQPNYVNPETRGPGIYVISPIFLGTATIVVFFRLYARVVIRRWFGLDDAFILVAWIAALGVSSVVFLASDQYGWDRHIWDIPYKQYQRELLDPSKTWQSCSLSKSRHD